MDKASADCKVEFGIAPDPHSNERALVTRDTSS